MDPSGHSAISDKVRDETSGMSDSELGDYVEHNMSPQERYDYVNDDLHGENDSNNSANIGEITVWGDAPKDSNKGPAPENAGDGHGDGGGSGHEEGGLVGATVIEGGGHVSQAGFALSTVELALQGTTYSTFGRTLQNVEHSLKSGEFTHFNGNVYSQSFRGNQFLSSFSVETSLAAGRMLRGAGNGLTIIGLGVAAYEFSKSPHRGSDYARLGAEVGITFSAVIPYVGPFISISLGYANSMGVFDPVYHYFDQ